MIILVYVGYGKICKWLVVPLSSKHMLTSKIRVLESASNSLKTKKEVLRRFCCYVSINVYKGFVAMSR